MHCLTLRLKRCTGASTSKWWAYSARTGASLENIGTCAGWSEWLDRQAMAWPGPVTGEILRERRRTRHRARRLMWVVAAVLGVSPVLRAEPVSLQALVTPSTIILKDGHPVAFAVHGFIEFRSLNELFSYIGSQTQRWGGLNDKQRQLAEELLRRGIESRVVSMEDERPLEK